MALCTSYNLLIEYTPRASKIIVGTAFLTLQTLPPAILPLYLSLFNSDVRPFLIMGFGLSISGLILTLTLLPESPHYLFAMERFTQCEQVIRYIAKFNGVLDSIPPEGALMGNLEDKHFEIQNRET
jgi:hypothetical protein